MKYNFHYKNANKDRLYLARSTMGRGLRLAEFSMKTILFNLSNYLNNNSTVRKELITEYLKFCNKRKISNYRIL